MMWYAYIICHVGSLQESYTLFSLCKQYQLMFPYILLLSSETNYKFISLKEYNYVTKLEKALARPCHAITINIRRLHYYYTHIMYVYIMYPIPSNTFIISNKYIVYDIYSIFALCWPYSILTARFRGGWLLEGFDVAMVVGRPDPTT